MSDVGPQAGPCEAWATLAEVRGCAPWSDAERFPDDLVNQALDAASEVLFQLAGRRFPGTCTDTVRPGGCQNGRLAIAYPDGGMVSLREAPGHSGGLRCGGASTVELGSYPIIGITSVTVDGEVLDPSAYRVADWRYLVRLDGGSWPCCGSLADTPARLEVVFTFGQAPPGMGVMAAVALTRELLLASCNDDACRLDRRVRSTTREGVSLDFALPGLVESLANGGQTGIPEVDLFVHAHNPAGLRRRGRILIPGQEPARRVTSP